MAASASGSPSKLAAGWIGGATGVPGTGTSKGWTARVSSFMPRALSGRHGGRPHLLEEAEDAPARGREHVERRRLALVEEEGPVLLRELHEAARPRGQVHAERRDE